jgi:hypothetical protein
MKRLFVTAAAFVCLTTAVSADPGPSINYLMNEPVSLFEYGLFLIDKNSELYLRSAREAYKNRLFMNFLVEYNYINNIIDINVYTLAKEENFVLDETSCLVLLLH